MPIKKQKVVKVEVVEVAPDTARDQLVARQAELLALLDVLDANKFSSKGHVENALGVVNRELAAL